MEIIISKVIADLDKEVYSLLELFIVKNARRLFVNWEVLFLEVIECTFDCLDIEIIYYCPIEYSLTSLQCRSKNIYKLKLTQKASTNALQRQLR